MEDLVLPLSMEMEMNGFVEQEEISIMESHEKETSKWTNEKHSLYLKSIEASFVDQLYNSLDMLSRESENPNASISSGQFKVLQRGSWSKKSFKRQNSHVKDADRPHVSSGNPWIQHFRNVSLKRRGSTATSRQPPVPDSQLVQQRGHSNTEVMGQNFEEDASCSRESVKASKISHSSNDQVVPHRTNAAN